MAEIQLSVLIVVWRWCVDKTWACGCDCGKCVDGLKGLDSCSRRLGSNVAYGKDQKY